MSNYFSNITNASFEEVLTKVTAGLSNEGFGLLTEPNVNETPKKIGSNPMRHKDLCVSNPQFAYETLLKEHKTEKLIPLKVIVQELPNGVVEVAAIDPLKEMQISGDRTIKFVAELLQAKLRYVLSII
jgi:uncharacterized protein (DUF302 family)